MKYTGPVRFILKGDFNLAQRYTSRSRLLLQQAMDRMGSDKAYWNKTLPDGTQITVSSLGGVKQVWITVNPTGIFENIRGYVIQTTLNEFDGDSGIRYLPMSTDYERVINRNYSTGDDDEWNGGNYVVSFGPNIWIKNKEFDTTSNTKYSFHYLGLNDKKYLISFDYSWNIYIDDILVDTSFSSESTIEKIVASPDGKRICVLHDIDEQISSTTQYYEYEVNIIGDGTGISLDLIDSKEAKILSDRLYTPMYGDTGTTYSYSDEYVWDISTVRPGAGCRYNGSPIQTDTLIIDYDDQFISHPIDKSLEFITDIEYKNNDYEILVAKTNYSDYNLNQSVSHITMISQSCDGSLKTPDDTPPTTCCDQYCGDITLPNDLAIHEYICDTLYIEEVRDDIIYDNRGQVQIGELYIDAYEVNSFYHQLDRKSPDYISPWTYSTPYQSSKTVVRMGLVWSVRYSACIYMEMESIDTTYDNQSWPNNSTFINRIVLETQQDGRTILYEGESGNNQMLWWGQFDHSGGYSFWERYAWNVVSFFWKDYGVWRLNDYEPNSDCITIRSRYKHTDANSEVLFIDLTIEDTIVTYAYDASRLGADKEMNRLIEENTFSSFTAI